MKKRQFNAAFAAGVLVGSAVTALLTVLIHTIHMLIR